MTKNVHESHPAWKIQPSPSNPVILHVVTLRWGVAGSWFLSTCWWTGTTSTRPSHYAQREVSSDVHRWSSTAALGEFWILGLSALCHGQSNWPSIMMTFMCQLDSTPGCPGMWWNPVSGCFWKRLAFALAQSKAGGHPQCGWVPFNPLRVQTEQNSERRLNSLSEC